MTVNPAAQAAQLFAAYYGTVVTDAAHTLPASTTGHLFTVSGGRVIVTSITGIVSTVIQAQACTISIGATPTAGSAAVASIAAASSSVSGLAVGVSLGVPAFSSGSPAALVFSGVSGVLAAADAGVGFMSAPGICLVPAGTIDWTTSATNTGAVTWSVSYIPYDAGATVTAL
jgi:hypothetical protein